jgi:hypothetical protein
MSAGSSTGRVLSVGRRHRVLPTSGNGHQSETSGPERHARGWRHARPRRLRMRRHRRGRVPHRDHRIRLPACRRRGRRVPGPGRPTGQSSSRLVTIHPALPAIGHPILATGRHRTRFMAGNTMAPQRLRRRHLRTTPSSARCPPIAARSALAARPTCCAVRLGTCRGSPAISWSMSSSLHRLERENFH